MTQEEFAAELDNDDIYYYESGAYYDTDKEAYDDKCREAWEQRGISLVEV